MLSILICLIYLDSGHSELCFYPLVSEKGLCTPFYYKSKDYIHVPWTYSDSAWSSTYKYLLLTLYHTTSTTTISTRMLVHTFASTSPISSYSVVIVL
jgi:hypothetical protein